MFGTKLPSITSMWIYWAPASESPLTSSPSLEKSAERMEGEMIYCMLLLFYSGVFLE